MIRKEWIKFYDKDELPKKGIMYQSWDVSLADASVCLTFKECKGGTIYLVGGIKAELPYPEIKREIWSQDSLYKPRAILFEDSPSTNNLMQDLRRETDLPILSVRHAFNKVLRMAEIAPIIESGQLFLPRLKNISHLLASELWAFPDGNGVDSLVDALSQFLDWARRKKIPPLKARII